MQNGFDVTPSSARNMNTGPITVADVSSKDFGAAMPGVSGAGGVLVMFFHARVKLKTKNGALDGKYETRLCIARQPKEDRATVATNFITEEEAKQLYPAEYHAFTANQDLPTTGTPLHELPGITQSQLGRLILVGLRSIEDLAEINEETAREQGFDVIAAHKKAQRWVADMDGNSESIQAIEEAARLEMKLSEAEKREVAMLEQMRALQAKVDALTSLSQSTQAEASDNAGTAVAPDTEKLPDIDDVPNPLAEGAGTVELPDPLADD